MQKDINYQEYLEDLITRRSERNPGIKNIRFSKFNKLKSTQWGMWLAAPKSELLK